MKVKLKKKFENNKHRYGLLTFLNEKVYNVLAIESDEWFTIIDENYEPIMAKRKAFDIIDNTIDDIWVIKKNTNYIYIGPEIFYNTPYFFENWFDNKEEERKILNEFIIKHPEYISSGNLSKWFYRRKNDIENLICSLEKRYFDDYNKAKRIYDEMRENPTKIYGYYCDTTLNEIMKDKDEFISNLKQQLADLNKFLDENPQYKS